jgi:hypothetical protein
MRCCPACDTELAEADLRCPQCRHLLADAELWEVSFASRENFRAQFDGCIVHRGLVIPRGEPVAPDTVVQLRLILPEGEGDARLTSKAVGIVENPSRPEAPYDVQLQLLDLGAAEEEALRQVAHREDPKPVTSAEAPPGPSSEGLPPETELDEGEIGTMLEALLRPWEPPSPLEPTPEAACVPEAEPVSTRDRLPEEVAQKLTEFTLHLVRAVTKASYYTAEHREAERAKAGLYTAFTELVADRPEITFHAHAAGEKRCMLVYGVFDEPTDLSQAMLKGTAEIFIPKLSQYFEGNGLVSISFKRALDEGEFHRFVNLLASPGGMASGPADQMLQKLAELRIHNISLVVQEDRLTGRHLSWRVEMALTRLKKDLSVIPLYEHLSEAGLQRVRLQVFRDVVRPLRQVNLVRELLENCDLVVAQVDELSEENLAEMEAQILASVSQESLRALLEGLTDDVVEAKGEGGERLDQLLRLTRRVARQVSRKEVEHLENAFRSLLANGILAQEELPAFVQQRIAVERNTEVFLRIEDRLLQRFDAESDPECYLKYLNLFETIFPELLSRADLSPAARVLRCASGHRSAPAAFDGRPEQADAWLGRLTGSSLGREIVSRLPEADKLRREALLELAHAAGEAGTPVLFTALRECGNAPSRQDLVRALTELKRPSLELLSRELAKSDLPSLYVCELLGILGGVGDAASARLASRFCRHGDPQVRVAALRAAGELEPAACERWALDALADRDRTVQEAALKLLFERRSTAPELFDFCGRILTHLDEAHESMVPRICSGLAGYDRGEARARSVALLLAVLGGTEGRGPGLWASLRRSLTDEPSSSPAAIAACHALGRMCAGEAAEVLTHLSKQRDPALRQAATRALERVEALGDRPEPS